MHRVTTLQHTCQWGNWLTTAKFGNWKYFYCYITFQNVYMCILYVHIVCAYCMCILYCILYVHIVCAYCMCILYVHIVCAYCMCILYVHIVLHTVCAYCMCILYVCIVCAYSELVNFVDKAVTMSKWWPLDKLEKLIKHTECNEQIFTVHQVR